MFLYELTKRETKTPPFEFCESFVFVWLTDYRWSGPFLLDRLLNYIGQFYTIEVVSNHLKCVQIKKSKNQQVAKFLLCS